MGTQQILLIALGVILVGIAVVVGMNLAGVSYNETIKDMAIKKMYEIGSYANSYRAKPVNIGGGGGTYNGYKIPAQISNDELAWTFGLRFGEDMLYIYLISKAKIDNGQPLYLLGLYQSGVLQYIQLYDPSEKEWVVITEKQEELSAEPDKKDKKSDKKDKKPKEKKPKGKKP